MPVAKFVRPILFFLVLMVCGYWLLQHSDPAATAQTAVVHQRITPVIRIDSYGIRLNGLSTIEHTIERNETFSEILSRYEIPAEKIQQIISYSAGSAFNARNLQVGKKLRFYTDDLNVRHIVYDENQTDYVIFNLADSIQVYERHRPVTTLQKELSGTITSSLFEAFGDEENSIQLAGKMAEVLAWQVDFYRIRKGDNFSIIYEEKRVDGKPAGIGDILAARFQNDGEDYYAFRYKSGETFGYYDQDGKSLKKAFLKSPLKIERITSAFSLRRFHPVQKRFKAHLGTDYAAPTGTPIYTVGDGTVVESGYRGGNGNYVKIQHNKTYTTAYLHMSRIGKGIRKGTRVRQGDVIGYVGSTGLATGPHVCFRFWKNGNQIDPRKEITPQAEPIDPKLETEFFALRDALLPRLEETAPEAQYAMAR